MTLLYGLLINNRLRRNTGGGVSVFHSYKTVQREQRKWSSGAEPTIVTLYETFGGPRRTP